MIQDYSTITKEYILSVQEFDPEKLFSNPDQVSLEYKILAKRFHPDVPRTGSTDVFQHINILKDKAEAKIKIGEWHIPGVLEIAGKDGRTYRIKYVKEYEFGLGRAYIANHFVAYLFDPSNDDLIKHATKVIQNFPFPHPRIKAEIEPRLTKIKHEVDTTKGKLLVLEKPADTIRLLDLLDYNKGTLDPRHVAWVLSELYSACCYLEKTNLTHNDLSLDTVFVNLALHTAHIIGGWWYSSTAGIRMQKKQSARTVAFAPSSVLKSKIADIKTDLELVKLTGRELLGDDTGSKLINSSLVPKPLLDWLRTASTGNAANDYKLWQDVLTNSFGPRKFINLDITFDEVYKNN